MGIDSNDDHHPDGVEGQRLRELGHLFSEAIDAAARGKRLRKADQSELANYLDGEEWFNKRHSRFSDEAKVARGQIMLLGRNLRRGLDRISKEGELSKEERKDLRQWLSNARLMRVRYQLKRLLYFIGYSAILILAVLFSKPGFEKLHLDPNWMPFIVAVAILGAALAKDVFLERNISIALRQITWSVEKGAEDLEEFLEENLEPRIVPLESRERIRREASKMFDEVIKDDAQERVVVFLGAASLGTKKKDEPPDLDEDKSSSVEEYNSKLTQMQNAGVLVKRYVALMKETDSPPPRRNKTRQEYVDWLTKQMELLDNNPKYILVDCHRAQPWGGSRSSIITRKAFLDMVGDGDSGFLIRGERVAEVLSRSSRKLLEVASQRSYHGGKKEDLAHLADIRTAVQRAIKADEDN